MPLLLNNDSYKKASKKISVAPEINFRIISEEIARIQPKPQNI